MHPAALSIEQLLEECHIKATRRGGPGGQHRNKTDTAIVVTHTSGIVGQAGESRSQDSNRTDAIHRLRLKLAVEVRTSSDQALSETWMQRCVLKPLEISAAHKDYPSVLAEALNYLAEASYDLAVTAAKLQISSSQILKLLRKHPPALQYCNRQREALGLHPLN